MTKRQGVTTFVIRYTATLQNFASRSLKRSDSDCEHYSPDNIVRLSQQLPRVPSSEVILSSSNVPVFSRVVPLELLPVADQRDPEGGPERGGGLATQALSSGPCGQQSRITRSWLLKRCPLIHVDNRTE